jgi:hypothetical protein
MRAAVSAPLDMDELTGDFGQGGSLEIDLPSHDPLVRRVSSGGMPAVRQPSEPPVPHSFRTPLPATRSSYPPAPEGSVSPPPVALTPSVPPVAPHTASLPPVSRATPQAPHAGGAGLVPEEPRFQFKLAAEPHATLVERLLPGGLVLGGAILVTILDQVYSAVSGQVFTIGPLRTSVLAGLVMVAGVGLCLYRLKRD